MKLAIYNLNIDGTVPDFIIDGGYLPFNNGNDAPQDYDLIGVANEDAGVISFEGKGSLLAYIQDKGFVFTDPATNQNSNLQSIVDELWQKIETIPE